MFGAQVLMGRRERGRDIGGRGLEGVGTSGGEVSRESARKAWMSSVKMRWVDPRTTLSFDTMRVKE